MSFEAQWIFGGVVTCVFASIVIVAFKKGLQITSNRASRAHEPNRAPGMPQTSEGPSSAPGVTRQASPPEGITRLNDALWRFYCPEDELKSTVTIIFFHGLQLGDFEDAFWKTWLARGRETLVWPKEWLPKKFSNANIFSVSYDASAKSKFALDMYNLGENLVADIILDTDHQIGQNCPVYLVGHSVGGLLIKQLVLSAVEKREKEAEGQTVERISKFLENLRGVFYYGTPHGGSKAAEGTPADPHESSKIAVLTELISSNNPILQLLKTLNKDTARINEAFRKLRSNKFKSLRTYAVAENLPTTYGEFKDLVVTEASARQDVDDYYTHPSANHVTVCKPQDEVDGIFKKLAQFIKVPETNTHHGQASASEAQPPLLVMSHTAQTVRDHWTSKFPRK